MTTSQSGPEFPFASNLLESIELMRKVWGAGFPQMPGVSNPAALTTSLPSIMMPTLDVDELDKRIGDLRAVEQWLALNANMLRASIQALEVQRNTIATLKSLGGALMSAPSEPVPAKSAAPPAAPTPARRARRVQPKETRPPNLAEMPMNPAAWWGNLQDQFTRIAAAAAGEAAGKSPAEAAPADANKPAARRPPAKRSG
ncbi:MAG TPA: PhaM family polyhydroxyalkanoate granule multifunctional regulatory protein [Burkholderiaceae bacterium]|nr:PhaM family polyhydroxyalkanoate granule multifunctional regulatory protein [Burkholderiaceae bacterium]